MTHQEARNYEVFCKLKKRISIRHNMNKTEGVWVLI